MTAFVWTAAIIWGFEAIIKLIQLTTGDIPARIPGAMAADVVLNTVLVIWAAVLLSR